MSLPPAGPERNRPLVSVLIPVHDVRAYVEQALDSVARQTHPNLEVIVVDDGSSDGTRELVEHRCRRDARFRLLVNDTNLRIVRSLNRALGHARGAYIARCDGDDLMEPDRIERQLAHLDAHPDVALVGCSFTAIDEDGRPLREVRFPSGGRLVGRLTRYCSPVSHIWLARREVYDRLGGYRLPAVEDYDFLLRAIAAGFGIDNVPDYLGMRIRVRGGNTVARYGLVQRRLFNYARRVARAEAVYSEREVEAIVASSSAGAIAWAHRVSDRLSSRAARTTSPALRYPLMAAAAAVSPYKAQYYLDNARARIECRAAAARGRA